jgi:hypothetical protein
MPTVADATPVLVLSGGDVTAMGGAGIGFASGPAGVLYHPAAPAVRPFESASALTAGVTWGSLAVGAGAPSDIANLGTNAGWSGSMADLGLTLGFQNVGIGLVYQGLGWSDGNSVVSVTEGHLDLAVAFPRHHLVFGGGLRTLGANLGNEVGLDHFDGIGGEAGILATEVFDGWNIGGTFRSAIPAADRGGRFDAGLDGVALSWQLSGGIGWHNHHDDDGVPVRVAFDLVVDGPVANGVSSEALLAGDDTHRGRTLTLSPRFGLEAEVWRDRLRLRGGTYLEPSRTIGVPDRLHGTAGLQVRLFRLRLFHGFIDEQVSYSASVDAAHRYWNLSYLGIGFWDSGLVKAGRGVPEEEEGG